MFTIKKAMVQTQDSLSLVMYNDQRDLLVSVRGGTVYSITNRETSRSLTADKLWNEVQRAVTEYIVDNAPAVVVQRVLERAHVFAIHENFDRDHAEAICMDVAFDAEFDRAHAEALEMDAEFEDEARVAAMALGDLEAIKEIGVIGSRYIGSQVVTMGKTPTHLARDELAHLNKIHRLPRDAAVAISDNEGLTWAALPGVLRIAVTGSKCAGLSDRVQTELFTILSAAYAVVRRNHKRHVEARTMIDLRGAKLVQTITNPKEVVALADIVNGTDIKSAKGFTEAVRKVLADLGGFNAKMA